MKLAIDKNFRPCATLSENPTSTEYRSDLDSVFNRQTNNKTKAVLEREIHEKI